MDVKMPLSFIFCLRKTNTDLENEQFREAGYDNVYRFFAGTSKYNDSVVGWLGHMENGSTYHSLEGRLNVIHIEYHSKCFRVVYEVEIGGGFLKHSEKD